MSVTPNTGMEAQGLLPCPFCGGEARLRTYETESLWSHDQVTYTQVGCEECDYHIATEPGYEMEAPERWNTRTPPADLIERLTSGIDREAVARIIDPLSFIHHSALYEYCIAQGDAPCDAQKVADDTHKPDCDKALAKADAIIALIAAAPSPQDAAHPQPEESNASHR